MKKVILTCWLLAMSLCMAFAQSRQKRIDLVINDIENLNKDVNRISNNIAKIDASSLSETDINYKLVKECRSLDNHSKKLTTDYKKLTDSLTKPERKDRKVDIETFMSVYQSLKGHLGYLSPKRRDTIYSSELHYYQEGVDHFLAALNNLRTDINSLIPKPPDHLEDDIKKFVNDEQTSEQKHIDSQLTPIKASVQQISEKTDCLSDTAKKISAKADSILKKLSPDFKGTQMAAVAGYQNNLLGFGYLRHIGKISSTSPLNLIGGELFVPWASSYPSSTYGVFGYYGFKYNYITLQAGIGWLNHATPVNVSWKCSAIYNPRKFGIGISYSPLTKSGLLVVLKW